MTHVAPTMVLGLLLCSGCASGDRQRTKSSTKLDDSGVVTATDWTDPGADDDWSHLIDPGPSAAEYTAADVVSAIDNATQHGIPDVGSVLSAYLDLLSQGDASCPGSALTEGFEVFGTCTAASGVTYSGVASLNRVDDRVDGPSGWSGQASVMSSPADYTITRVDGTQLSVGAFFMVMMQRDSRGTQATHTLRGTVVDTGGPAWAQAGFSGDLFLNAGAQPDGATELMLEGSMSVGSGSLILESLRVSPDACPDGVAGGALSVRMTDGTWLRVVFHSTCSACGTALDADGQLMGDACINPGPWLSVVDAMAVEP